jgi:hypothetical protein
MDMLPKKPLPLDIRFALPEDAFSNLAKGHESIGQGDPWSAYFRSGWLQIWRPDSSGWFCYALRFEQVASGEMSVAESWIGREIRSNTHGLGEDLARHREIVNMLLIGLSGHFQPRSVTTWFMETLPPAR